MDRLPRTLLLLYFLGLALSAAVAFALTGAWGPPSPDFVNAMSVGLFLGMMAWFVAALGHGYMDQSREERLERDAIESAAIGLHQPTPDAVKPERRGVNFTIVAAAFGASYLGLGLLFDAVTPYGFWVTEAVILALGAFLALEYVRVARAKERDGRVDSRRCDRCKIECTYLPKFNAWHCPRCGSIYEPNTVMTTAS